MKSISSKRTTTIAIALLAIIVVVFLFAVLRSVTNKPVAVSTTKIKVPSPKETVIGTSVQGRKITAYTYGSGNTKLAFVGGIHGGYEWNSVLLAYKFMDYLETNSDVIPSNLSVVVIPSMNPDGVYKVIGKEGVFTVSDVPTNTTLLKSGRFNADKVDLNRNFDCRWQPTGTWQGNTVSAGTSTFSEPEAVAFKNFALKNNLSAVIFWHSQSNGVYASQCLNGILSGTTDIMNAYAKASGYPAEVSFDSYAVTGAADDWLSTIKVPAVSVELKTHDSIEWNQNLAGIQALFKYFGNK